MCVCVRAHFVSVVFDGFLFFFEFVLILEFLFLYSFERGESIRLCGEGREENMEGAEGKRI